MLMEEVKNEFLLDCQVRNLATKYDGETTNISPSFLASMHFFEEL